ncbi:hypothetical protein PO124_27975 [Bacillus licheniformis]|nr:hypothetical protein [Bacillus licheniformis]
MFRVFDKRTDETISKLTRVWIVTPLSNLTMTRVTTIGNTFSLRK